MSETEAIVAWLRGEFGAAAVHLILMSGMPGGTRTERIKNRARADGFAKAVSMIAECIERGDHMKEQTNAQ